MEASYTILVVDDDPLVIQHVFETLHAELGDYTFLQANNGQIALSLARQKHPRLIITDWDMPVMNGIELIRQLKLDPDTAAIPVIVATGVMVSSDHLKLALEAGAMDFIRKPLDPVELKARANAMLTLADHISEIKLMNESIQDFNVFLQNLINIIPYPLVHYDQYGTILTFNEMFRETFRTDLHTCNSYFEYLNGEDSDLHKQYDRLILLGIEKVVKYDVKITFPDLTKHDIVFTKVPVFGQNKEVKGILGVLGDLTELKQAHADALQKQRNELAGISMRLAQTIGFNEKLMKDIERLRQSSDPAVRQLAEGIGNNYRLMLNENFWNEFETRFTDVHVDFYKNLASKHPGLTSNERKLCAFLKLDLTTKEIASITFQNAKSIDMARYRLRKRLGLDGDESLQNYLQQF